MVGYEQRPSKNIRREYLLVRLECTLCGAHCGRIPLFHADAVSIDPEAHWGDFVRVFPPD